MKVCDFFRKTRVDCLAISYGTKHGAQKGRNTKIRKEIAISSMENLRHENIFGILVSHGSSTVPPYIVNEINALGGMITEAHGIPVEQLEEVIRYGIGKINIDTDIRLAVTRNIREYFSQQPEKRQSKSIGKIWSIMGDKPDQFDPRVYLPPIMDTLLTGDIPDKDVADIVDRIENGVREIVGTMIVKFGSVGYAPRIELVSLEEMANRYKKEAI
jgi:fructose-bisphosphate aldolase class II